MHTVAASAFCPQCRVGVPGNHDMDVETAAWRRGRDGRPPVPDEQPVWLHADHSAHCWMCAGCARAAHECPHCLDPINQEFVNAVIGILRSDGLAVSHDAMTLGSVLLSMHADERIRQEVIRLASFYFFQHKLVRYCARAYENMQTTEDGEAACTVFVFLLVLCFCTAREQDAPARHRRAQGDDDAHAHRAAAVVHAAAKSFMLKIGTKNWFCKTRMRISNTKVPFQNMLHKSYPYVRNLYAKFTHHDRPRPGPSPGERFPLLYAEQPLRK